MLPKLKSDKSPQVGRCFGVVVTMIFEPVISARRATDITHVDSRSLIIGHDRHKSDQQLRVVKLAFLLVKLMLCFGLVMHCLVKTTGNI